jgi:branched-chain amino acid transport system substrate-binding protein
MPSRSSSKWSLVRPLVVGLAGGWLAAVQASADPCPAQCPSGKIPLGIAAPTSGQAQAVAFGRQIIKAVEVSVRELNAAGGLMGIPVQLTVADDRCEPGAAVSAANRQVGQEKLSFVIGPACPPAAMATAPIYSKAGVVQFLPTVPVTALGTMQPSPSNAYSVMATDEQEAQALGDYLAREQTGKKLTVVYSDAFYKRDIVQTMKDALPPDARTSARFEPLLDSTGVYERLADKLKRESPDIIYLALDHGPLVEFVGKLRQRSVKALLIGGQQILSYSFWLQARAVAEGIQAIVPAASPATPDFSRTIDLLKQSDVIPDLVAFNSYATVQIWAEAVRRAGGGDPQAVIAALLAGPFQTAIGPVAFDAQGKRRDIRMTVLTWQDGRPKPVQPPR